MRPGILAALGLPALLLSAVTGLLLNWGEAEANHGTNSPDPDLGWTWKDAKAIGGAVTDNHTLFGEYVAPITDLVNDWFTNTVVKPTNGDVANHATNRVHYHGVRLGTDPNSAPIAQAFTYSIEGYSQLTACQDAGGLTGDCNKTNHRATYADIDLNDDLLAPGKAFGNDGERRHTVGHELGHPFGLSHPADCPPPSGSQYEAIMRRTGCAPFELTHVADHDITDMANLYP